MRTMTSLRSPGLGLALAGALAHAAIGDFGLSSTPDLYTVDTGTNLVFSVRRTDPPSSRQSAGDIASLLWKGVEYQAQDRGSHIGSGFPPSEVTAESVDRDTIVVKVASDAIVHYYVVRRGLPHIYMATHATPKWTTGETRWITRLIDRLLPGRPPASNLEGTDHGVESKDVFGMSNGETRSKYYGNSRAKELPIRGVTGDGVGIFMVFGNRETSSGGPFFRDIQNQSAEVYNYMNSGHNQTEPFRFGLHAPYALVFTDGSLPERPDMSFMEKLDLVGAVPPSKRGTVSGSAITGRDTRHPYTVALSNDSAQYWADASLANGAFRITRVKPGDYTLRVFKNELAVHTDTVTLGPGRTINVGPIEIKDDPAFVVPVWRIGEWDGAPTEFLNGDKVNLMHPSDVRMAKWNPAPYVVGKSTPANDMPCYQWRGTNDPEKIEFTLAPGQVKDSTVRIGITAAFSGGRPAITINGKWSPGKAPGSSNQPKSRSLTIGTYRGNNTTFTYDVPATELVAGRNTLSFGPISGSGGEGFLAPGYSIDCIEFTQGSQKVLPPEAPGSFVVKPAAGGIELSWSPVDGASGYLIRRGSAGDDAPVTLGEVTETHFSDKTAQPGTSYQYAVSAVNSAGVGEISIPQPGRLIR